MINISPTENQIQYVNNFQDQDKPCAIRLPAGKGRIFKEEMDHIVDELKSEVPKAFESKEYEQAQEQIEQDAQHKSKVAFWVCIIAKKMWDLF